MAAWTADPRSDNFIYAESAPGRGIGSAPAGMTAGTQTSANGRRASPSGRPRPRRPNSPAGRHSGPQQGDADARLRQRAVERSRNRRRPGNHRRRRRLGRLTPQLLAAFGDRIRVVRNDRPLGFAAACTAGIVASSHPNLVLLNNDTVPEIRLALGAGPLRHPSSGSGGDRGETPLPERHGPARRRRHRGENGFPQHIYLGFPSDHPAVNRSRRFPIVTFACCLDSARRLGRHGRLRSRVSQRLGKRQFLSASRRSGTRGPLCHDAVVYHFESATRDPAAPPTSAPTSTATPNAGAAVPGGTISSTTSPTA